MEKQKTNAFLMSDLNFVLDNILDEEEEEEDDDDDDFYRLLEREKALIENHEH